MNVVYGDEDISDERILTKLYITDPYQKPQGTRLWKLFANTIYFKLWQGYTIGAGLLVNIYFDRPRCKLRQCRISSTRQVNNLETVVRLLTV
jgi:hypothetical protein